MRDTDHRDLGDRGMLVQRFFDEHWIDAPVRPHKRGGAFCAYTVPSVHPYILLNFTAGPDVRLSEIENAEPKVQHGERQLLQA